MAGMLLLLALWVCPRPAGAVEFTNAPSVVVVIGASGEQGYGEEFEKAAKTWEKVCAQARANCLVIGRAPEGTNDLAQFQAAVQASVTDQTNELWLVLIGHGTFNGKDAKFNLRGPDLAAADLAKWMEPVRRPVAVLNCFSSSAPFLNALSRSNRVVVTATRSGGEQNYSRFGTFFAEAMAGDGDVDKDGQTSLLEAFLVACKKVEDFYASAGRLATEHALLDDNGDGLGTASTFFKGIRAVKKAAAPDRRASAGSVVDGLRAHQFHLIRNEAEIQMPPAVRARRDQLELDLAKLRDAKAQMKEDVYYGELEKLLLELARLYEVKEAK